MKSTKALNTQNFTENDYLIKKQKKKLILLFKTVINKKNGAKII